MTLFMNKLVRLFPIKVKISLLIKLSWPLLINHLLTVPLVNGNFFIVKNIMNVYARFFVTYSFKNVYFLQPKTKLCHQFMVKKLVFFVTDSLIK